MREPSICLDHLVIAASNLIDGARYLENKFGVALDPGGQHAGLGTHNRVLALGGGSYLELIAPDPEQPEPAQPRAFGLDGLNLRERLSARPRLIHYVTRTSDINLTARAMDYQLQKPVSMSRGDLSWQLAVASFDQTTDLTGVQLLPSMIDWGQHRSPGHLLTPRGVTLSALHLGGPQDLCAKLRPLLGDRRIRVSQRSSAMLTAEFQTPNGWVILD